MMPLNDPQLEVRLTAMFSDVDKNATPQSKAQELRQIISEYVRSATVAVQVSVDPSSHQGAGTGGLT